MCGIAGAVVFQGHAGIDETVLSRMRDQMVHRGPDGGGNWISRDHRAGLAHRRLSIIDLSSVAAQPMSNEDETVWITFNGEIYNHAGLRHELIEKGHRFRTDHCDTEVLVHGYEEWGIDGLLERIHGDYGFGIWDDRQQVLSLARDRIGVKPVYFSLGHEVFLFGSEIKAILQHPAAPRDIDPAAMYHYLSFMTTPAPMTMFQGIYKLPAGYYLQVSNRGQFRAHRYWDATPGRGIPQRETAGLSENALEEYYLNGIRQRLHQAVECRMMSDVPFGVFLSGGIDSTTNVALMSRFTDRPLETFTVGFKDYTYLNELDEASLVAKKFNTHHHEILIDHKDMMGYLKDLVFHQDEPIADWVCIPLYFVSKLARDNGVTVVQVGEGSDEQFCGYAGYMAYLKMYRKYWAPFRKLPQLAQRGLAFVAKAAADAHSAWEVYADILQRGARDREHFWTGATVFWDLMKAQLIRKGSIRSPEVPEALLESGILPASYLQLDSFNIIQSFLEPFDRSYPKSDVLSRMTYNEFKLRLPELLLMRVDKIGMSESLEARVPFLDHRLVEFTMDIPMEWKTRGGTAKYLLKKAVRGLIPDEIIDRKKMGFGAPMSDWLKGQFGYHVEASIMNSELTDRYFNPHYIAALFHDHRNATRQCAAAIWTLFNLTAWYDYWILQGKSKAA